MFCTACGTSISDSARFCSNCGKATGMYSYAPGSAAPRRFFRLRNDKMMAGLCAGLARYLDLDVSFLRLLAVAIFIVTGFLPIGLAYIIGWIIVPVEEYRVPPHPVTAETHA
ncbi:MAG: PspC domain-containing protein [Bryobacterales bacterium]|nr:PspC domain-containing protein [Bryobacterales bacterium]